MTPEQIIESFESWYKEEYVVRDGARGVASRHLSTHNGEYISDHARELFKVWCTAVHQHLRFKNNGE